MSETVPEKRFGPIDKWREASGLYKLGFDAESFKGLMFPFLLMVVPVILAIAIWKWL